MMRKLLMLALLASAAAAIIAIAAAAMPPAGNGRIAFTRFDPVQGDDFVFSANPDGSQEQQLLPTGAEGPAALVARRQPDPRFSARRRFRTDRQSRRRELPRPGESRPRSVLPAVQRPLVAGRTEADLFGVR